MSIGPILLMIMTSFKQNVDIMNDMSGLFFTPTSKIMKPSYVMFFGMNLSMSISVVLRLPFIR